MADISPKRSKLMRIQHISAALLLVSVSFSATADCFDDAAAFHGVNPWILRAISVVETNGCRASQVERNSNGSVDVGCTQTNSIHFPELRRYGVEPHELLDPCKSVHVAAWLLRKKMIKHGNTWNAIGAYHSETPRHRDRYAAKVRSVISTWNASGHIK